MANDKPYCNFNHLAFEIREESGVELTGDELRRHFDAILDEVRKNFPTEHSLCEALMRLDDEEMLQLVVEIHHSVKEVVDRR